MLTEHILRRLSAGQLFSILSHWFYIIYEPCSGQAYCRVSVAQSQLLMLWFFGLKPRWNSYKFWRGNTQVISSQCWPSPCSASKLFVCILNLKAFKPSTSICICSILFSIHSLRCWEGEFVQQSRVSSIGDHFLIILVTLKFDLGVIS